MGGRISGTAVVALAFAIMAASTASVADAAAHQCFQPAEIEAEQAVRFQTELMVVSDTCGDQTYIRFARRNREMIAAYQRRMIEHFRRTGEARAEANFDHYLTQLANEVSLRTGARSPAVLCHESAEFLATADALNKEGFRRYVAEQATRRADDYPRCAN